MDSILQNTCNNASSNLHYLYNDSRPRKTYPFDVCTKKKSGSRIRAKRIELKMTLKDVHELIPEISISRLSNWEQGINMVSVDEAKKLANALKVPAAYLLTLDDSIIDDTERMLLEQFRAADMRGRKYILRAAQDETGQHGMAGQGQIAKLFNIPPSASGGASSSLPAFNTDKKTGDEEDVHE